MGGHPAKSRRWYWIASPVCVWQCARPDRRGRRRPPYEEPALAVAVTRGFGKSAELGHPHSSTRGISAAGRV